MSLPLARQRSTGVAGISVAELTTQHDIDLRARTLTSLLAALREGEQHADSQNSIVPIDIEGQQTERKNDDDQEILLALKVLNSIAQLFVREYEIIAVLPKRTGREARMTLFFTSNSDSDKFDSIFDSDSDSGSRLGTESYPHPAPDWDSQHDYNYNYDSLGDSISPDPPLGNPPSPTNSQYNPVVQLSQVATMEEMVVYLHRFPRVPFSMHVASMEFLLNAIIKMNDPDIAASKDAKQSEGTKKEELGERPEKQTEEAVIQALILRCHLLKQYVTFRSAGKMHRRFCSMEYKSFFSAMQSVTAAQLHGLEHSLTEIDHSHLWSIIKQLHIEIRFVKLVQRFAGSAVAPSDIAMEVHQLLLLCLQLTQTHVDKLYQTIHRHHGASSGITVQELESCLERVQGSMDALYMLAHNCPCIQRHIMHLENFLCAEIKHFTSTTAESEVDTDAGLTETVLELTKAREDSRMGQELLWLAVSFYHSIATVAQSLADTVMPITFVLCDLDILQEDQFKTCAIHEWRSVMYSMFPSLPQGLEYISLTDSDPIHAEEAIDALSNFAQGTRGNSILQSKGPNDFKFKGCCHAEAILATMRYLSMPNEAWDTDNTQADHKVPMISDSGTQGQHSHNGYGTIISSASPNALQAFRNTYPHIGVSKRCCPICTKLISLLFGSNTSMNNSHIEPSKAILASHNNIYPTALPPYLPTSIAKELLYWLEKQLRPEIEKVVLEWRSKRDKRKSITPSAKSTKSADSKGQSPGKNKKKRGKGKYDVMSLCNNEYVNRGKTIG